MMLLSAMENEATTLSMRRFGAPLPHLDSGFYKFW
jgi:hypothetical protein